MSPRLIHLRDILIAMHSTAIRYTVLAAAILVAAAGFWADIKHTAQYGGVDLRNRVTAARVANELRKDPYTYKWSPNDSDRYLDPADNITIPYARVTVPPTILLFHNLISGLPYRTERWIWFTFQWAALIASLALLGQTFKNNRTLIWALGLLSIAGSQFFRLHIERGQIYIWYVLLFSAAVYLYKRAEEKSFTSALILGYLISLRPPFLFALIPFVLAKKFKFVSLTATGMLASVLVTGIFFPFALWKSYYASTSFQGAMRANPETNFASLGIDVAEGMNIVQFLNVPGEDSSLQRIVHAVTNAWLGSGALAAALLMTIAILALMLYWRDPKTIADANDLFLVGVAMTMLAELFIPAPRWPYADVIWLIPIALLTEKIIAAKRGALRTIIIGAALAGLVLNTGLHSIAKLTLLGEYLFIGALVLALFLPQSVEREVALPNAGQA